MANDEMFSARLDRIEEKIDKLSEAMISIARAETKITAMEADRDEAHERLNKHSARMDVLEDRVNDNYKTIQIITRIFWITFSATFGASIVYSVNSFLNGVS